MCICIHVIALYVYNTPYEELVSALSWCQTYVLLYLTVLAAFLQKKVKTPRDIQEWKGYAQNMLLNLRSWISTQSLQKMQSRLPICWMCLDARRK